MVGQHPYLGFQIGYLKNRISAYAELSFKFLNSRNHFYTELDDSLHYTNHFFGGYVGGGFNYEVKKLKSHSFDLLTGVAFDGFDVLSITNKLGGENYNKSINSLNINTGVGYRFTIKPLKSLKYLGLDAKYNWVNYNNQNGTNLKGNSITVGLRVIFK